MTKFHLWNTTLNRGNVVFIFQTVWCHNGVEINMGGGITASIKFEKKKKFLTIKPFFNAIKHPSALRLKSHVQSSVGLGNNSILMFTDFQQNHIVVIWSHHDVTLLSTKQNWLLKLMFYTFEEIGLMQHIIDMGIFLSSYSKNDLNHIAHPYIFCSSYWSLTLKSVFASIPTKGKMSGVCSERGEKLLFVCGPLNTSSFSESIFKVHQTKREHHCNVYWAENINFLNFHFGAQMKNSPESVSV